MSLADCLDLGASLVPTEPCLVAETTTLSYAETQGLSRSIASSLRAFDVGPGDTIGVLSPHDPLALTCILGASRAGAGWTLVDPSGPTMAELVGRFGHSSVLVFHATEAELARTLQAQLPQLRTLVCLDGEVDGALGWGRFLVAGFSRVAPMPVGPPATATATAPEQHEPVSLAVRPLSEETSELWEPVLARGGRIVMHGVEPSVALSALQA